MSEQEVSTERKKVGDFLEKKSSRNVTLETTLPIVIPHQGTVKENEDESCLDAESKENINDVVFVMEPTTPLDESGNKKLEIQPIAEKENDPTESDISESMITSGDTMIRTYSMPSSTDEDFDRLDDAVVSKHEEENVIEHERSIVDFTVGNDDESQLNVESTNVDANSDVTSSDSACTKENECTCTEGTECTCTKENECTCTKGTECTCTKENCCISKGNKKLFSGLFVVAGVALAAILLKKKVQ